MAKCVRGVLFGSPDCAGSLPEWVVQWSAVGVENGGRLELDKVSADGDVPSGGVHPSVVGWAEQNAIFHFRVAVVIPLPDVVSVAQCGRTITTRESTSAVSGN